MQPDSASPQEDVVVEARRMHGPNDQNDMVAADIQAFGRIRTCANHFFANIAYGVLDQFPEGNRNVRKDRIGFDPKDGQNRASQEASLVLV